MNRTRTILVIDDDPANHELLASFLKPEFHVIGALSGGEGVRKARTELPDIILLDLLMPEIDGIRACEILRGNDETRHIPIIVLTGSLEVDPRVEAFLSGADDLVLKPFNYRELLARIRSKIRRIMEREGAGSCLQCGNLQLDLKKLEVRINQEPVQMSVLEFNLLKFLVQNKNCVLSRQQILDNVWKDSIVSDRTVDTHMASIRKKLQGFDHVLATVYSAGYVLKEPTSPMRRSQTDQPIKAIG